MPPERTQACRASPDRVLLLALTLWAAALAAVTVRALYWPRVHSLFPTFATAGADWWAGTSVYFRPRTAALEAYRYPPATTVLLAGLHPLPEPVGGACWRLLNGAVFLGGLVWWLRRGTPLELSARQHGLALLLVLPFAIESLNNGQPNLMMAGALLAAGAAAAGQRWWLAAAAVTAATLIKVYPLSFGLLVAACHPRRFAARLVVALAAGFALPFLFQSPDYVAGQYAEWARKIAGDDRKFWPVTLMYRDLWLLLRVADLPMTRGGYLAVQLLSAAGCALLCVRLRLAGADPRETLTTALGLASCWMMLCGPATESATYVLLAPPLAYALLAGRERRYRGVVRWLPVGSFALLCLPALAGVVPAFGRSAISRLVQPLGAAVLAAVFVVRPREGAGAADVSPPRETVPPAARAA